ncbi:hypothetical protein BDM02DRAFT_3191113 [Thelephora ganbajun]|uniref:Uncharacterized protein n=1 Tax=Thelephora ganbajun TaxID=370292 RepID=A0ACB6Z2G2_THEGA|nr:hypothetical protein BDM02DRAFT_3191113 [Thelephora ganbajun]
MYPPQWTFTNPTSDSTTPSVPPVNHPHLPQYKPITVISAEDFSDEEAEVEPIEDFSEEADKPAAVQFLPPQNVLQDHWQRNGPLAPAPPPSTHQAAGPVQYVQPAPVQHIPSAPVPPTSAQSALVPTQSAPVQEEPVQQDTIQPATATVTEEPFEDVLTLPTPQLDDAPLL